MFDQPIFDAPALNIGKSNRQSEALAVYTSGAVTYVCRAAVGTPLAKSQWQIMKIDEATGIMITWADGDDLYDNSCESLATVEGLTYS